MPEEQELPELLPYGETGTDINQQQSPIPSSEIPSPNMEIHAHHLHHAPGKKIWHYFYEFLMLFLAVFCGFLAENFREHQVEKERADQYIRSFYEDLKTDTAALDTDIQFDQEKLQVLGNMYSCYDTIKKNWQSTACLWELVKKSRTNRRFLITDRTLNQLTNAGGFRLLKKEDADSIISYMSQFKIFDDFQTTVFQEAQDNVRNTFNELAEFSASAQMRGALNGMDYTILDINKPLLFSSDKFLLNKYFNELNMYMLVTNGQKNQMERLKRKAVSLMEYCKSKHNLDIQ